jgi:hypothetical protein
MYAPRAFAEKRARILRDGQLTMIVYGSIEALTWARRVAMFQNAMRQAPQRSLHISCFLLLSAALLSAALLPS